MKRSSAVLVSYSSSEDEDGKPVQPPKKRLAIFIYYASTQPLNWNYPFYLHRKLPSLPSSLVSATPVDRPELHQGRVRSTPHVDGQWAAHIYLPVLLERHSLLAKHLDMIMKQSSLEVPCLHSIWEGKDMGQRRELHVSLSRPVYLRAYQREELKRAVRLLAGRTAP
jgi:U6 snRNA phosphodiesterase